MMCWPTMPPCDTPARSRDLNARWRMGGASTVIQQRARSAWMESSAESSHRTREEIGRNRSHASGRQNDGESRTTKPVETVINPPRQITARSHPRSHWSSRKGPGITDQTEHPEPTENHKGGRRRGGSDPHESDDSWPRQAFLRHTSRAVAPPLNSSCGRPESNGARATAA